MRILVVGAGVIGSVYADGLLRVGHEVVMFARGQRLADLRESGIALRRADTGQATSQAVEAVSDLEGQGRFDVVLVPVRSDQVASVLPLLSAMADGSDVVFFGNYPGAVADLKDALGDRVVLGFPAIGGVREGGVVSYVPIAQQRTMLGEAGGPASTRTRRFAEVLTRAGFPTSTSDRMDAWLRGHAAFIAPIGCALKLAGIDAQRLARDRGLLWLLVRATRQGFRTLEEAGTVEIPANLRTLYLRLPLIFSFLYWKRVFASPRGELWFAAHTRAAPEEMMELADSLRAAVRRAKRPAPDLLRLIDAFRDHD